MSFGAPWIQPNPADDFLGSIEEQIGSFEAIPPGVLPREGSSKRYPTQVPDLIGIKDRRYLDHTGLVRHRSIGDLMRYGALNQDARFLSRYGDFVPADVPGGQCSDRANRATATSSCMRWRCTSIRFSRRRIRTSSTRSPNAASRSSRDRGARRATRRRCIRTTS